MPFNNPIVAGLTLIRSAIKSPNYVAGTSGWSINRDGTLEANSAVIRGALSAAGGSLLVNDDGVTIDYTDVFNVRHTIIMSDQGFSYTVNDLNDPLITKSTTITPQGVSVSGTVDGGTNTDDASLSPGGWNVRNEVDDSTMYTEGRELWCADPTDSSKQTPYIQRGTELMSATATSLVSVNVTFPEPLPTSFSLPTIMVNIDEAVGTVPRAWVARARNISRTGFSLTIHSVDSSNATFSNVGVSWLASCKKN